MCRCSLARGYILPLTTLVWQPGTCIGTMADLMVPQEADKVMESAPRPVAMELCCGHAGLNAVLQAMGWNTRPVDLAGNRHKITIPVLQRDLTDQEEVAKIIRLLKKVSYLHFASPCGTASKARERYCKTESGRPCPRPAGQAARGGISPTILLGPAASIHHGW